MREQYIRQVEKELPIPRRTKREVIRDLREIFASALEHGETEQQVIGRLGTPREFAESTAEQLGIDITTSQNQKSRIWGIAALTAAAAAFAAYGITQSGETVRGAIGQANAMTNIKIGEGFSADIPGLLLATGILAAAAAVVQLVRSASRKRR